jgi:hypothetical protein
VRRLREQSGQVTIELLGLLPWLLVIGLLAWQVLFVYSTDNSATNAARSASREAGIGGDWKRAGRTSLPSYLRDGAEIRIDRLTGVAHVKVDVPLIVPLIRTPFKIDETAKLPNTGGLAGGP